MTLLFYESSVTYGAVPVAAGFHLSEGLQNSGEILVRDIIFTDYTSVQPIITGTFILSAVYIPLVNVTSFDVNVIKMYGGNPTTYKLGTLTHNHLDNYGERQYIDAERRAYPLNSCIIVPEPVAFPPDMSALPLLEEYDFMFRITDYAVKYIYTNTPARVISQKFVYNLESSVIANIGFFYWVYANIIDTSSGGNVLGVGI